MDTRKNQDYFDSTVIQETQAENMGIETYYTSSSASGKSRNNSDRDNYSFEDTRDPWGYSEQPEEPDPLC